MSHQLRVVGVNHKNTQKLTDSKLQEEMFLLLFYKNHKYFSFILF